MSKPGQRGAGLAWPWILAACLAIGALLSVSMGQDASWDLRNYHLYNAWAWLSGRGSTDLAAAGLQSFFNPAPDVPYFLLLTGPMQHAPRWLAAIQGLWYGLLVFCLYRVAAIVARLQRRTFGVADGLVVLIGASGTMAVSQAGLTSNEIPTACLVLAGVALLLHSLGRIGGPTLRTLLLAGLCSGLAAGLKPTAIVYPVAGGFAALLALRPWQLAGRSFAALALGSLAGFLLAYGWWGWHLCQLTGNPVFPMFNQVFHSPWAPASGMTDTRFLPRNWAQWLAYPFYWLQRNQSLVTEPRFADPRYAMAFIAVAMLATGAILRRRTVPAAPHPAAINYIAAFWAIAYVQWLLLFSILRYAVPLEALSGVLALGAMRQMRRAGPDGIPAKSTGAMLAIMLTCLALTHYPNWGHVPFTGQAVTVNAPTLPDHSLVLLEGMPLAYLPPLLPQGADVRYIGINWFTHATRGHQLYDDIAHAVLTHRGPRYVLRSPVATIEDSNLLSQMLAGYREVGCRPVVSSLERDRHGRMAAKPVLLCRLTPPPDPPAAHAVTGRLAARPGRSGN